MITRSSAHFALLAIIETPFYRSTIFMNEFFISWKELFRHFTSTMSVWFTLIPIPFKFAIGKDVYESENTTKEAYSFPPWFILIENSIEEFVFIGISFFIGPPQVKCRLLILAFFMQGISNILQKCHKLNSSISKKMSEINCIKNARNWKSTFDLSWTINLYYLAHIILANIQIYPT